VSSNANRGPAMKAAARFLNAFVGLFGIRVVRKKAFERLKADAASLRNSGEIRARLAKAEESRKSLQQRLAKSQAYNKQIEQKVARRQRGVLGFLYKHALADISRSANGEAIDFAVIANAELEDAADRIELIRLIVERLDAHTPAAVLAGLERLLEQHPDPKYILALPRWWYSRGDIGSAIRVLRGSKGDSPEIARLLKAYTDEWLLSKTGARLSPVADRSEEHTSELQSRE